MLTNLHLFSQEDSLEHLLPILLKITQLIAQIATLPCKNFNDRKQAINDKLQASVSTYLTLRCGGVANNQVKKGLLLRLSVKKN